MNIQLQSQMAYGDTTGLRDFFFVHHLVHQAVDAHIAAAGKGAMANAVLDSDSALDGWAAVMRKDESVPSGKASALTDWLHLHAALHQGEYSAFGLGIAPDLGVVDFSSERQFYDWMLAHREVHDTLNAAARITT